MDSSSRIEELEKIYELDGDETVLLPLFNGYLRIGEKQKIQAFLEGKNGDRNICYLYDCSPNLICSFSPTFFLGREATTDISLPSKAELHINYLATVGGKTMEYLVGNERFKLPIKRVHDYTFSFAIYEYLLRKYIEDLDIVSQMLSLTNVTFISIFPKTPEDLHPLLNLLYEMQGQLKNFILAYESWNTMTWYSRVSSYISKEELARIIVRLYYHSTKTAAIQDLFTPIDSRLK